MRNVRTVILAAVSPRDLYYVSENKSFCFGQKPWSRDVRVDHKSYGSGAQKKTENKKLVPILCFWIREAPSSGFLEQS